MANFDAPRGFRLFQMEGKTVRTRNYVKTAAAVINEGDLLMRVPAGTVEIWVKGTIPAAGIVVGIASSHAVAADANIAVIDEPEATYIVQTADVYATADNGLNADIAAAPVANTDLNRSGQEIDMSTKASTATLPFKIVGLAPKINDAENADGTNADLLVKINQSERGAGTVGI